MAEPAVHVEGLRELQRALRESDPKWAKGLAKAFRDIARREAAMVSAKASASGGQLAHFASVPRGTASASKASIRVPVKAAGAFWGAKPESRSGWNDGWRDKVKHPRQFVPGAGRQFRPWVGNSWGLNSATDGPYAIAPALHADLPWLERRFAEVIDEVMRQAFPDK